MRTGTAEGDAHDFRRRTYPSFGDDAVALAACGTDVAGEDRAGWRPRPPYDWQWRNRFIADRIEGLSRCVAAGPARRG